MLFLKLCFPPKHRISNFHVYMIAIQFLHSLESGTTMFAAMFFQQKIEYAFIFGESSGSRYIQQVLHLQNLEIIAKIDFPKSTLWEK